MECDVRAVACEVVLEVVLEFLALKTRGQSVGPIVVVVADFSAFGVA